jgi:hypothetical protein
MSALGNPSYSPSPVPPGPVVSPAPAAPPPSSKRWIWYLAGALTSVGSPDGCTGPSVRGETKQSAAEAAVKPSVTKVRCSRPAGLADCVAIGYVTPA